MLGATLWIALLIPRGASGSDLRVVIESEPVLTKPLQAADAVSVRILHQLVYETLLTLGDSLRVEPGLVQRWEHPTPTRYRFHLRPGARFASGDPVDARDAVATLECALDPATGARTGGALREKIARIGLAPGENGTPLAFDVDLKRPSASFLGDLIIPVLSRSAGCGATSEANGSGPYRIVSQSPTQIVLGRSETYPGPGAQIDRVVFKIVRDENTRLLAFLRGDVDLGVNVLSLDKLDLFTRSPLAERYRIQEGPGLSFEYLGFNLQDKLLADRRVRQAIAHAIDVDALIQYRQRGHAVRAVSLMPPQSPEAWPGTPPRFDPALAEKLLDEAGYPRKQGKRFALVFKTSTDQGGLIRARAIQADLAKIGISVEIRPYEWATYFGDIKAGNFQLYALRWIGVSDPSFLADVLLSDRMAPVGLNRNRYSNPEVDRLLRSADSEINEAKRRDLYRQVDKAAQEDLPYLALWHNHTVAILSTRFDGFRLHPTGGFQSLPLVREASGKTVSLVPADARIQR